MVNDKTTVTKKSKIFCGLTNKGDIIPAENQATDILPNISEALPICC